jgi:hypothetical protein
MAQIAIPVVMLGALYLMSNDKKKEGFNEGSVANVDEPSVLLKDNNTMVLSKPDLSKYSMNGEGDYSQYQDKYFTPRPDESKKLFRSLDGNDILTGDVKHSNMQMFYNSKSYGTSFTDTQILDSKDGKGSLFIEKKEIASLFKPTDKVTSVFGNQNQNDFYQSRVQESSRHANDKPWQEIRDQKGNNGFNWGLNEQQRPKSVDELRVATNPKTNYENNYRAPAYDPKQIAASQEQMGKFIKKTPETFKAYHGVESAGIAGGIERPRNKPIEMLTKEERETTTFEYYGVKLGEEMGYATKGQEGTVHKQTYLGADPLNLAPQGQHPSTQQNYGKESYTSYTNGRDSQEDYYGTVGGMFMANVVDPIVKTLRYSKKMNTIDHTYQSNLKGGAKPLVFNPHEHLAATHREMDVEKIGLNYLNTERQQGTGYQVANPYLEATQRQSTQGEVFGQPKGKAKNKSYDAEYNQRNIVRDVSNRFPLGNAKQLNVETNFTTADRVVENNYRQMGRAASVPDSRFLGVSTSEPQQYRIANQDPTFDLLKAFKSNPYTQPIGSVA